MKKYTQCIIATFLLIGSANKINAQYQNTTIYTPAGTSVTAGRFVGTDYTSSQKNDIKNYWLSVYNNRITYQGEATYKYNCHAYAWHVSNSVSQVWINTPEQKKYWNDYSYVEVSNPVTATKVSFGGPCYYWDASQNKYVDECDHSAVTTSTADYFISKWGPSPLFRHHKNDCPYSIEDLHYYARPAIIGSGTVCNSGTYALNNAPVGTIYWTVSNTSLFSVNPSGRSTVVTRNTGYGTATLSARIGSTSGTVVATKVIESVSLNSSPNFGEQPVQYLSCGESVYITPPYAAGVTSYAWTYYFVANYNFSFWGSDDQWEGLSASATFYENGYYVFDGYALNACRIQSYDASIRYIFEVTGCNSSSAGFAYPNPVSGILTIDVDAAAAARSKPVVQSITGAQSLKPAAAYDLRLYDGQGNLLRQRKASGGTVEFNVANLPNGVYYLHIYDGTGEKPNVQQIVIEH